MNSKKIRKIKDKVTIYVQSSFNNTILTATDSLGCVVASASGGSAGFKNSKKSTPFAAQMAVENLAKKLKLMGVTDIVINMKGLGAGRESVIKGMYEFNILALNEVTPIKFNGVRLPKARRS